MRRFGILDRYLVTEVVRHWLAVTLVLWAVVVSNRLARYLAEAAAGHLPGGTLFTLIGLKSVTYLSLLLPLSLYIGILLALGRLYRDSEMVALAACGVGPGRLLRPVLGLGVLVGVLVWLLSWYLAPRLADAGYRLQARAEQAAEFSLLAAGTFHEVGGGSAVVYAERLSPDHRTMENLFLQGRTPSGPMVATARRGYLAPGPGGQGRYLILEQGARYQGMPGDPDFDVMRFRRHGILLRPPAAQAGSHQDAVPTDRLLHSSRPADAAELQWRLAFPVAAVVLSFLAVPLSRSHPREGRYGRLFVAILLFIVYYNLLTTAQVWVARGRLPVLPGLWWVHLLPLLAGALLLAWQRPGRPRPWPRRRPG